jgi:predicted flap endonuclease-1-like 5' DNA nuclease
VPDNPRHHDDVAGADDLTRIGGIGSKIADRLYAAGILTYADLASRSADEISKLLSDVSGLSAGRFDRWRDQARELAAETAQAAPASPAAEVPPDAGPSPARPMSSAVLSVGPAVLRAAEPFTMTMTIELPESASHGDRLAYSAVIAARPMAGGPKRTVADSDGLLATASPTITVYGAGLPSGAYRLDGAVSLREPGRDHPVHLAALAEGLLVQVLPG